MSFPFLQPYAGLSNSLQTAQAGGAAGIGGWVELGRTTLGGTADTITVAGFSDKRYYMVLAHSINSGAIANFFRTGNGSVDTGSNYSQRRQKNGGSDTTQTSAVYWQGQNPGSNSNTGFGVGYLANLSDKEKLFMIHHTRATSTPERVEVVGKWANTSNPLDQFNMLNVESGSYASGTELVVLGWDPADEHTSNFWEELASVELGSAGTEIDSGTISAKKYLWVQAYLKPSGGSRVGYIKFNNDTTSYAWRRSNNGGADVTGTSDSAIRMDESRSTNKFVNFFVINNSSNQKLVLGHSVTQNTAGAANAPERDEFVGKHDETGAQITSIQIRTNTGNWDAGTILKVWGAD